MTAEPGGLSARRARVVVSGVLVVLQGDRAEPSNSPAPGLAPLWGRGS